MKLSFHPRYAVLTLVYMLGIFLLSSLPDNGNGGLINLVPGLLSKVLHVLTYAGLAWCVLLTLSENRRNRQDAKGTNVYDIGQQAVAGSPPAASSLLPAQSRSLLAAGCLLPAGSSEPASRTLPAASCRLPASYWTRLYALTGLLASAYAASDEWHQSFIPGRSASLSDVLLDCFGAGLFLLGHWVARRRGLSAGDLFSPTPKPSPRALR